MTNAFNLSQLANNTNSSGQVAAGTGISGTLGVANGGTSLATLTTGNLLIGAGTSAVTFIAPSTSGNALVSNGTTWASSAIPAPAALSTASGSAPSYSARAWVNFNGTGTVAIRASGNVSSVSDNGTGIYTVNFTTAISDANYSVVGAAGESDAVGGNRSVGLRVLTTSSAGVRGFSPSSSALDLQEICVAILR